MGMGKRDEAHGGGLEFMERVSVPLTFLIFSHVRTVRCPRGAAAFATILYVLNH